MNIKEFDMIIVGAGPGGAAAGITAAKKGLRTLILEKEQIGEQGRYKACGGALGWEMVDELKYPEEKIGKIIESLELHHIDGEIYSKKGKGAVVFRGIFDKFVLDMAIEAGTKFSDNEGLKFIKRIDEKTENSQYQYEIRTNSNTYRTKYIIAADGVNSRTLSQLSWPNFQQKDLVLTITDERKTSQNVINTHLGADKVHLFFGIHNFIPMGYAWLFPKSEMITVGWGNRLDLTTIGGNYQKQYQKFLNLPIVNTCLKQSKSAIYRGHFIPVGVRSKIYQENVFAIGDAGGFVDPISGKGIPYAMLSGEIAVKTILKCENKGTLDKMASIYTKKLDSKFMKILKLKYDARERIFANDHNLKKFLSLWESYRSSEIVMRGLI